MASLLFQLNTIQGSKIKQISIHPFKDWVGVINENNTFSLWNYQQKILIKSFSCNTLDDNKNVEIKQIVFFDKYSLCYLQDHSTMKNNIIFVTNTKLIFYDYITDAIKQTSQKDLDQKSIRKVCVYSQSKICIAMSDGSFKVLETRQSQMKGSMSIRTVKGFHSKPITWIFAYSQNYNEMPRVVTASDQDGLMACWNIQMILKSNLNQEIATPCFRFQSLLKKSKQSVSSQQIHSLQYDPSNYKLITLNEQLIRIWSTMTGTQLKRIKNTAKYREIIFCNHFTYVAQSFVTHTKSTKLIFTRNMGTDLTDMVVNQFIELKNFFPYFITNNNPQQQAQINRIYSVPQHPSQIFVVSNYNMAVIQIDKFYPSPFGSHHSFFTRMSTINSRDLINKAEGEIRKNMSAKQINGIKFQDDILTNSFFLSVDEQYIYFNLLEIQYSTMLSQIRKYKIHMLPAMSPLRQTKNRSIILVNFDGNQIIVFNKQLKYYQIYSAFNAHQAQDLLNHSHETQHRIDFYTKFEFIGSGYARDIIYHQYKKQYAIITGFDDKQNMVQYRLNKDKMTKNKGDENQFTVTIPVKFRVLIYQYNGKQYSLIQKSNYFTSKSYKLYNFGSFYGYSSLKQNQQIIQHISSEKGTLREIQGYMNSCQQVYISYCENYYILSYDKYFILLKEQQNGSLTYFRTFQYTILHGYFWQKFFFFLTQNSLYFLQIVNDESVIIKIGSTSKINLIQKIINDIEDDDFEPQCELLPVGQQQIINIVNMSLVLINSNGTPNLISLAGFPYIVFCLEIASGAFEQSRFLYKNASKNIAALMKQTMINYGMIAPDLG